MVAQKITRVEPEQYGGRGRTGEHKAAQTRKAMLFLLFIGIGMGAGLSPSWRGRQFCGPLPV